MVLFGGTVWYLTLLAGFSTTKINAAEHSYLVRDAVRYNLLAAAAFLLLVTGAAYLFRRLNRTDHCLCTFRDKLPNILLCVIALEAVVFVLSTQRNAVADQLSVQLVADRWQDGNYQDLLPGAYMNRYPGQAGIVLICMLFSRLFGTHNYLAFQFLNILALVRLYKTFGDLAEDGPDGEAQNTSVRLAVYGLGMLFLPGILYTNFVYGNIIGLALSLMAYKAGRDFIRSRRPGQLILAILALLTAVLLKQNYLIFGIAMLLCALVDLIRFFQIRTLVLSLSVAAVLLTSGLLARGLTTLVTGRELSTGLSSWSWLAMGLRENKTLYDGWWDNYNVLSYNDSGYDTDAQAKQNKQDIQDRIDTFVKDPGYAVSFFAKKNASQWNNPDFQAAWVNGNMTHSGAHRQPAWVSALLSEEGTGAYSTFTNYLQFIILAGVLLRLLIGRRGTDKTATSPDLFYALAFLGGFIFHTFWEAKGQYILSYFWLLLPLSAEGYAGTAERLLALSGTTIPDLRSRLKLRNRKTILVLFILLITLLVTIVSPFRNLIILDEDTYTYRDYIRNKAYADLQDGIYRISPKGAPDLYLTLGTEEDETVIRLTAGESTVTLSSTAFKEWQTIRFSDDYALEASDGSPEDISFAEVRKQNFTRNQGWHFKKAQNESEYYILRDGRALTWNEGDDLILEPFTGGNLETWIIVKE